MKANSSAGPTKNQYQKANSLLQRLIGVIHVVDAGLVGVARMNHHAVTEPERLAHAKRETAVARRIVFEIVQPENVGRQQAIAEDVPIGGLARVRQVIENRDP